MGLHRILIPGLVALLVAAPVVAQSSSTSDFYPYRGYCGLAAVAIHLFGYGETVQIGASLSGAPASYVASFIAWCGSRGVGGDGNPSAGPEKSECTFSTDCPKSCSGSSIVQNDCVNYKCVPPPRTVEQCSVQVSSAAGYSFPYICTGASPNAACGKDTAAILAKREALQAEFNAVNAQHQEATTLFLEANKICLSGLALVTHDLIVGTATKFLGVSKTTVDVISFTAQKIATKLILEFAGKGGPITGLSDKAKNDFYLDMCVLEKTLKETDLPLFQKKMDKLLTDIRALNALL